MSSFVLNECISVPKSQSKTERGKRHLFSFFLLLWETLHTICHFAEGGNSIILQKAESQETLKVFHPRLNQNSAAHGACSFLCNSQWGQTQGQWLWEGSQCWGRAQASFSVPGSPRQSLSPESLHSFPGRPTIQSSISLRFLFNQSSWESVLSVGVKSLMLTSLV